MGYVLAAVSETAFMGVSEWHKSTEECRPRIRKLSWI
jgi:hypothetical protein